MRKSIKFHGGFPQGASQLIRVSNGHSTPGMIDGDCCVGNLESKVDVFLDKRRNLINFGKHNQCVNSMILNLRVFLIFFTLIHSTCWI